MELILIMLPVGLFLHTLGVSLGQDGLTHTGFLLKLVGGFLAGSVPIFLILVILV